MCVYIYIYIYIYLFIYINMLYIYIYIYTHTHNDIRVFSSYELVYSQGGTLESQQIARICKEIKQSHQSVNGGVGVLIQGDFSHEMIKKHDF